MITVPPQLPIQIFYYFPRWSLASNAHHFEKFEMQTNASLSEVLHVFIFQRRTGHQGGIQCHMSWLRWCKLEHQEMKMLREIARIVMVCQDVLSWYLASRYCK